MTLPYIFLILILALVTATILIGLSWGIITQYVPRIINLPNTTVPLVIPPSSAPPNITVPDGVTFKLVHKNGWHSCVEDRGVLCKGPYTVNETIQKYQNLGPPSAPRLPQAYILPTTALPSTSNAKNNSNSSGDINITHTRFRMDLHSN